MMNKHERKGRAMDRRAHYRKIYQDTITRAGIVEGRLLTDYEKGAFCRDHRHKRTRGKID